MMVPTRAQVVGIIVAIAGLGQLTFGAARVLSLDTFSGKGGLRYNLRLAAIAGASERVSLGSSRESYQFWISLRPGQLLRVQRFAAAGYHLTQRIVAVSDGQATMMTLHSPDSGARPNMVNVVLGSTALLVGLLIALRPVPGIRTVA